MDILDNLPDTIGKWCQVPNIQQSTQYLGYQYPMDIGICLNQYHRHVQKITIPNAIVEHKQRISELDDINCCKTKCFEC